MSDSGQETFSSEQWRIEPTVIWGRSNVSNYLEHGTELTLKSHFVNPFSSTQGYSSVFASFKLTQIVWGKSNFALFSAIGATLAAFRSYQFTLGGIDSVRGYSAFRVITPNYAYLNIEFRPYLFSHRFDWEVLEWIVLQGALFTDWGTTLKQGALQTLGSIGAGFRINFVKYSGAILRFDYAQTLTPNEGGGISFGIGQLF